MVEGERSYRALFAIEGLPRIVASMQLARIGQSMAGVALVLFTLHEYNSPLLAGVVTFVSTFPGIVFSPIAGALLDRHGRIRLIALDYVIACASVLLIGALALADALPPALLVLIACVSSITAPLSQTGLRSLFPLLVPENLWERVNAVDSNGYLIASVLGPSLAAGLFAIVGPQLAVAAIGVLYGLAAISLIGARDPAHQSMASSSLLADTAEGLRYAWHNRTIRGLIFGIGALNLAGGIQTIVVPVLVLDRLNAADYAVGAVFALSGIAGIVSVFLFGRVDSRGREWRMLVYPMALIAPVLALLLVSNSEPMVAAPALALALIGATMFVMGALNGPLDIGLFTIRQRRTSAQMMGRAFAVSMALNFSGFPIGAALAGVVAEQSLDLAIVLAVVAAAAGTVFTAVLVPRTDRAAAS